MCDIWQEFRAALCISGGNRCPSSPTLPPPDPASGGDQGGGRRDGEDRLSALPDDVLLFILSHLPSAAAAARTSVLSRRWRRLWAQLPLLWFPLPAEPARALPSPAPAARTRVRSRRWCRLLAHLPALRSPLPAQPARALRSSLPVEPARVLPSPASARAALAQHSAPSLWVLSIIANDADPGDTAAVLRLAAPRLTRTLFFSNVVPVDRREEEMAEAVIMDAIELPCFHRTERLLLHLGYLCIALPPAGVFTKLTVLVLSHFRFQGASNIGGTFSSARCPSLRELRLSNAQGVSNLSICSESLVHIYLGNLKELQQLTIVSPMLRDLYIINCFFKMQSVAGITAPVADITAPVLKSFGWLDEYDLGWVQLGELAQLQILAISFFAGAWYGLAEHQFNWGTLKLLQRFKKIPDLHITIFYPKIKMIYSQYGMETLTSLPVKKLHLVLLTCGHAIGSCVFHFLKVSPSIRKLFLDICGAIKEGDACSPDCFCHEEQDWETEELFLNSLQELYICGFNGSYYDFAFVRRLLGWAGVLKSVTMDFDPKATADEELCEELLGLSGPDTCMKIYLYRNGAKVINKTSIWHAYDPRLVQLGKLAQLRELATSFFAHTTHGLPEHQYDLGNVTLLQRYREIADLRIRINYPTSLVHIEYLMEAMTLPPVKNLHLILVRYGHRIGSCVFHFLKISTSIRRLFLNIQEVIEAKTSCLPGCFCHGKEVWENEALVLNSFHELYICGFNGSDYDFAFVKRLLGWARKLKSVDIKFDPQEIVDEELCKELLSLSGPETCMKNTYAAVGQR